MSDIERDAVMGRDDMIARLEEILARLESGEIACAALRVFHVDGTWEDVALGGDEQEQAEALAELRRSFEKPN